MKDTYDEFRKIRDRENHRLETMPWDDYVREMNERTHGLAEQIRQKISARRENEKIVEQEPETVRIVKD